MQSYLNETSITFSNPKRYIAVSVKYDNISQMTITLSKNNSAYVSIPRKEYREYLEIRKIIPIVMPTKADIKAIKLGRKEIASGNFISWQILKNELANTRNLKRSKTA